MKTPYALIILAILFITSCGNTTLRLKLSRSGVGFLSKKECLDFLVSNTGLNKYKTYLSDFQENDTIGRYYRIDRSGHYLAYIQGFLLETDKNGRFIQVKQRYDNTTYCYCLENEHDKFRKIRDSFCITLCQTGLGYYACYLQLCREFPKGDLTTIPYMVSYLSGENIQTLTGEMEFKNDVEMIMHYSIEEGIIIDDIFKSCSIRNFTVKYVYRNNSWQTDEYEKFKGTPVEF